jgi:uncharacterized membrane protein YesL
MTFLLNLFIPTMILFFGIGLPEIVEKYFVKSSVLQVPE